MSVPALLHGFILREIDVRSITEYFRPYLRLKLHILTVKLLLQGCYRAVTCDVSVPALLHEFILREVDVTLITQYFRPYLRLKLRILRVTLLLQELECYSFTELSHESLSISCVKSILH